MYTMEHYSAIKEKEILPFVTTQIDITLSKMSLGKTNTVLSHLYIES